MNDRSRHVQPALMLPIQARPVRRSDWTAPSAQGEEGIQAAQSLCDNLTGMAQQLCYCMNYGICA
jgi:hypothetical protein